ncbi:hypothetical protein FACS1894141_1670 [Spirochaetia bacterium]|nr:hypothetical protein FACS1894141_1670 [Spirochaetia bacterium]
MVEYITPDRIANAILQDTSFNGYYLLVEGEKDSKLYNKFIDLKNVRIRIAFGCKKVMETLTILENRLFDRRIGIIDRDFYTLYEDIPQLENLFITDYHDIEVMMFISNAFDNMLRIYTTEEKITEFERTRQKSTRDIIFELSNNIGYLKLAEKKYNFGLVFKPEKVDGNQIKYNDIISDKMTYKGDSALVRTIVNYSWNKRVKMLNETEILEKYLLEKQSVYDNKQLSNGHDLSNIIFIFLKKTVRSTNKSLFDFNTIEDNLILAYEYGYFKTSALYNSIETWSKNKGIKIFS